MYALQPESQVALGGGSVGASLGEFQGRHHAGDDSNLKTLSADVEMKTGGGKARLVPAA